MSFYLCGRLRIKIYTYSTYLHFGWTNILLLFVFLIVNPHSVSFFLNIESAKTTMQLLGICFQRSFSYEVDQVRIGAMED